MYRPASVDLMIEKADNNRHDLDIQRQALHPRYREHMTGQEIRRIQARIEAPKSKRLYAWDKAGIGDILRALDPDHPTCKLRKNRSRDRKKERREKRFTHARTRRKEEKESNNCY